MSVLIKENEDFKLYSGLFTECNLENIQKIDEYVESFRYENDPSSFQVMSSTQKQYSAFAIIVSNENIIEYEHFYIYSNKNLEGFLKRLKHKTSSVSHKNKEKIIIKCLIIEHKEENNTILKRFEKEFFYLKKLFKEKNKEFNFDKITGLFLKNIHYFIVVTSFIVTILVSENLLNIGVIIENLSLDTLSLITYLYIKNMIKAFLIVGGLFLAGLFIILFFDKIARFNFKEHLKRMFLSTISFIFIAYSLIITLELFNSSYKIDIIDLISKKYIAIIRVPSVREVEINSNKDFIFYLGKDTKYIYYLKKDMIKKIIEETHNSICKDLDDKKISYIDAVINLLKLTGKDYIDNERKKEIGYLHIIENQRRDITEISNVKFLGKPSFDEAFCK
ncbi:hypothetical protein [Halarcobacter sp.]|uniref:hypothetical protein n=1 Tax=Halarcobacter sp. TaxID=2321133 RepID=UPI002AABF833|nr:hypothetical protein [Halarcobacter sp.]